MSVIAFRHAGLTFGYFPGIMYNIISNSSGCGSVGRAPALGAGGPQFESAHPESGGYRIVAIISPFQGEDAGSTPATRSKISPSSSVDRAGRF